MAKYDTHNNFSRLASFVKNTSLFPVFPYTPWKAVDIFFILSIVVLVLSLFIVFIVGNTIFERIGWLDPEELSKVKDERILKNFRGELIEKKFLASVLHTPQDAIYISKSGGNIHKLDLKTKLWSDEQLPSSKNIPSNLVRLQSGCGVSNVSDFTADCGDSESIWGIGENSEIIRLIKGNWDFLFKNSRFINEDGTSVKQEDLSTVAISADLDWIFLTTVHNTLALYNNATQEWHIVFDKIKLENQEIQESFWWNEKFWVSLKTGLFYLKPNQDSIELTHFPTLHEEIIDTAVDQGGEKLLVFSQGVCEQDNPKNSCFRVTAYKANSSSEYIVFNETNKFPELSFSKLSFAKLQNNKAVTAGKAGVFSYDPQTHSWKQLDTNPVSAILDSKYNETFFYGYNGGVSFIKNNQLSNKHWEIPGKRIKSLIHGKPSEVLALTQSNDLFSLKEAREKKQLYVGSQDTINLSNTNKVFRAKDSILLITPSAGYTHNYVTRTQSLLSKSKIPAWVLSPNIKLAQSNSYLFGFKHTDGDTWASVSSLDKLNSGEISELGETPSVNYPLYLSKPWGNNDIIVIDSQENLIKLNVDTGVPLIGQKEKGLTGSFKDVLVMDDGVFGIFENNVRFYNSSERAWSNTLTPDNSNFRVVDELIATNHTVLGRSANTLFNFEDSSQLLGDPRGFKFNDNVLTDVLLLMNNYLYLAGPGSVIQYDMQKRRQLSEWNLSTNEYIDLLGISNGKPLSFSKNAGQVWWGTTVLSSTQGVVNNASYDNGKLLSQRTQNNHSRLLLHTGNNFSHTECLFTTPSLGTHTIIDARVLNPITGWTAVLSNKGLHFYSKMARSWFLGTDFSVPQNARLYILGDFLTWVWTEQAGTKIFGLEKISNLKEPDSCQTHGPKVTLKMNKVNSLAIDEERGHLAWIKSDGSIHEWVNGKTNSLLGSTKTLPISSQFKRVFVWKDELIFTTQSGLWFYNSLRQNWRNMQLNSLNSIIENIILEPDGNNYILTVSTKSGKTLIGELVKGQNGHVKDIKLSKVTNATIPSISQSADTLKNIISLSTTDELWGFVFQDRLKIFNSKLRKWTTDIIFHDEDSSRIVGKIANVPVINEENGKIWWIAKEDWTKISETRRSLPITEYFHKLDLHNVSWKPALASSASSRNLFQLMPDGSVYTCENTKLENCKLKVAPPLHLNPANVIAAYNWIWSYKKEEIRKTFIRKEENEENSSASEDEKKSEEEKIVKTIEEKRVLFETVNRLYLINPDSLLEKPVEIKISGSAKNIKSLKQVYEVNGKLWILTQDKMLYQLDGAGKSMYLAKEVEKFTLDREGVPWIITANIAKPWDAERSKFISPEEVFGLKELDTVLALSIEIENDVIVALTDKGCTWIKQHGIIKSGPRFPLTNTEKNQAIAIFKNDTSHGIDWWIQNGSTIDKYETRVWYYTETNGWLLPSFKPKSIDRDFDLKQKRTILRHSFPLKNSENWQDDMVLRKIKPISQTNGILATFDGAKISLETSPETGVHVSEVKIPTYDKLISIKSQWENWKKQIVTLDSGEQVLNPVTAYKIKGVSLYADRPSGDILLDSSYSGTIITPSPSLDIGWLRWETEGGYLVIKQPLQKKDTFSFSDKKIDNTQTCSSSEITLYPNWFIQDGELIFASKGQVVGFDKNSSLFINKHGIWQFADGKNLSLSKRNNGYYPINLTGEIIIGHQRIVSDNGVFDYSGKPLNRDDYFVPLGDACIRESLDGKELKARYTFAKDKIPSAGNICKQLFSAPPLKNTNNAFANYGFLWNHKHALGYDNGRLILQSDAGIHLASKTADFDLGLTDDLETLSKYRIYGLASGLGNRNLYLQSEANWHMRAQQQWQQVSSSSAPNLNWKMLSDGFWTWEKQQGKTKIQLQGKQFGFSVDALGFSSDRLQHAAVNNGKIFVINDAFIEVFSDFQSMAIGNRLRYPHQSFDRMDVLGEELYTRLGKQTFAWDWQNEKFKPISLASDPYEFRILAETDRLKFEFSQGRVDKWLKVDDANGQNSSWAAFQFNEKGFPFDTVTNILFHENQLYVGTEAGLEIYNDPTDTSLNGISRLIDLRQTGEDKVALKAVSYLGIPFDEPDAVVVATETKDSCLKRGLSSFWKSCDEIPEYFTRSEDGFWSWLYSTEDRRAVGLYVDSDGDYLSGEISVQDGRMPHDEIRDLSYCQGNVSILWKKQDYVTLYRGTNLSLAQEPRTYDLTDTNVSKLHCLKDKVIDGNVSLSPGLYAEATGEGPNILYLAGRDWEYLATEEAEKILLQHVNGDIVFTDGRFRLQKDVDTGHYAFAQRETDNQWHIIPWKKGRLSIDRFDQVFQIGERLWAATEAGFVSFIRNKDDKLAIDPKNLDIVRDLTDLDGQPCKVTDFEQHDDTTLVRCNHSSDKLFAGILPAKAGNEDRDVFVQMEEDFPDIFAERLLIGGTDPENPDDYWNWWLVDHKDGRSGRLEVEVNGEPLELSGGRFDMDNLKSITSYEPGFIDVVSHGGGWYRVPVDNWHMKEFQRVDVPIDPRKVQDTYVTMLDGWDQLCIELGNEKRTLSPDGELLGNISECPKYLGSDDFWHYTSTKDGIRIQGEDFFGRTGERSLEDGRFGDNVATGFPVAILDDGELYYEVPTRDGIVDVDANLQRTAFFFGAGNQRNYALYADPADRLFSMDGNRLVPIDPDSEVSPIKFEQISENLKITNITDGPEDSYKLTWEKNGQEQWAYFDRQGKLRSVNQFHTVLEDKRYRFQDDEWNQTPWRKLRITFAENASILEVNNRKRVLLNPHGTFNRLAQLHTGRSVFILEPDEFWEIRLDVAMRRAMLEGQDIAPKNVTKKQDTNKKGDKEELQAKTETQEANDITSKNTSQQQNTGKAVVKERLQAKQTEEKASPSVKHNVETPTDSILKSGNYSDKELFLMPDVKQVEDKEIILYKSKDIRLLQEALLKAGCDPEGVDGMMGDRTRKAIRCYKQQIPRYENSNNNSITLHMLRHLESKKLLPADMVNRVNETPR